MEISKTLYMSKTRFRPMLYDRIQWINFMRSTGTTSETVDRLSRFSHLALPGITAVDRP